MGSTTMRAPRVAIMVGTMVALAAALPLAGCGDKRTANASNFKAALDAHYASHCLFVTPSVGLSTFPVSVDADDETTRYDALAAAGLLSETTGVVEHPGPLGIGTVRTTRKTYALTPAGAAAFSNKGGAETGFCAGHYAVSRIVNFTQPATASGRTVSSVEAMLTPSLAAWTTNPAVQQRYGAELGQVHSVDQTIPMVLTGDGWVVAADAP